VSSLARAAAAALLVLALGAAAPTLAQDAPRPPCGGDPPFPAFAPLDAQPAVGVWTEKPLKAPGLPHVRLWTGTPPIDLPASPCIDWTPGPFTIALSARFRELRGVEALVERFAATAALKSLPYWAAARERWEPLFEDVYAVRDPQSRERREDFRPEELVPGRNLHIYQDPSGPVGGAVYRMHIQDRRADRLAVLFENVTSARVLGLFPLRPGTLRFVYVLERLPGEEEDLWGYYALLGLTTSPDSARTYVNRSAALYRHLTAIPPQQEPPVWP
jgi:hypothetical protein